MNTKASKCSINGEVDENVDETASESKWRTSLRKKFSRLGRKGRPMSWSIDSSRSYNDGSIGLSSQSLYSPCEASPINNIGSFDRNRKTRSFLFQSSSFREGDNNDAGKGFFRKMFMKKKDSLEKVDNEKSSMQALSESRNFQTLESISERKSSKGSVKSDTTGSTNHFKDRIRKFVSKGTLSSSFGAVSTKFRDRPISQDLNFNVSVNRPQLSDSQRTLSNSQFAKPSFCKKRHSAVDCYRSNDINVLFENTPSFNGDDNSIRYIDSSSEEDIQSHLQENNLEVIDENAVNGFTSKSCDIIKGMQINEKTSAIDQSLSVKIEVIKTDAFANNTDKKPPDKFNSYIRQYTQNEFSDNKNERLQSSMSVNTINSCPSDYNKGPIFQYKPEVNRTNFGNINPIYNITKTALHCKTLKDVQVMEAAEHLTKNYVHDSFKLTHSVFSIVCLCEKRAGSNIDGPAFYNMKFCRGNNIFNLTTTHGYNENNYECQMHYVIRAGLIIPRTVSKKDKWFLERKIYQSNESDIIYLAGHEFSLENINDLCLSKNYQRIQVLKEEEDRQHNYSYINLSGLKFVKLFNVLGKSGTQSVQNVSLNSENCTNLSQIIAFNEQFCNEILKPNSSLLKLYSLIKDYYNENSKFLTKNISDKYVTENTNVILNEKSKENVEKTDMRKLSQTQTELEEKTEGVNLLQESLRKSKRKRKRRKGKNKQTFSNSKSTENENNIRKVSEVSETSVLLQHSDVLTQPIEVVECFDVVDASGCNEGKSFIVINEESDLHPISVSVAPESHLGVLNFAKDNFEMIEFETCQEDIEPLHYVRFKEAYQRNEPKYEALSIDSYEQCKYLDVKCTDGLTINNGSSKVKLFSQISEPHGDQRLTMRNCYPKIKEARKLRRSKSLCQNYMNCGCTDDNIRRIFEPVYDRNSIRQNKYVVTGGSRMHRTRPNNVVQLFDNRVTDGCDVDSGVDTDGQREVDKCFCFNMGPKSYPYRIIEEKLRDGENDKQSVRWLLCEAEEILASHQVPENTLNGVSKQVDRFHDFFSFAKFESEKSLSLLPGEEHFDVCSEASEDTQDLAKNLRRHITSFADRLHLTKDRLEDTAKCYLLLDKAYEWALEAMKVVGRVKSSGTATLEQVGAAAEAIGELLRENPPVSEDTFTAMLDLATKLDNQTLLQQCKMAHARCKETISLLRNRQSALLKARHQMEFDCQSFVDLNEILSLPEESSYFPPSAWPPGIAHSSACRRRSVCSLNSSRPRDPISRCSSIETDDDSVFSESPFSSTPSKTPLEGKSSLRGIKELRESDENLRGTSAFIRGNANFFRSSIGSEMRISINDSCPLSNSPSTINNITGSNTRAFSSGSSSSCSSSESSGPISGVKKDRNSLWRFTDLVPNNIEEANDSLEDQINLANLSAGTNSHLLIRGSQINLSNSENLTQEEVRKNKTLLLIMQELIQTERDYVNSLEYIIENFLPELLREDIPQALRGQRNVIFGNIEKIYEFHSGYFVKELENCRSRPFAVGSIFLRYENQFYLYALYNKNKPKSDELMADFGSLFFKRKQMMLGDKMDLSSYLLKPVQRMGKYALLLKQLLKECEKSEEGYDELKSAQEMVQFQLRHGNDLLAMDSLRDCDVNLKEQGRLLRQGEFLVTEGSRGRKSLRHVFLFEDLILFSKSRKDPEKKNLDIFQYKQSLKTTDIGLTAQVGESPLRFEIWFRKRKPSDTFHFQSNSLEVKEAWTEEISKLLWRQALRNRKLRLHEMSSMGIGNKPCLDIRPSEDQISDRSVCIGKAPPRLRLSTSASLTDATSGVRRPHSVISVSSSASSAESSTNSSAGPSFVGTLNLGFESGDSPKPLQRSVTRTSQCSAESGIITDIFPERESEESHSKVERSNSTVTNTSVDSALSPPTLLTHCQSSPLSALEEPSNTELPVDITPTEQVKIVLTTEV